MDKEKEIYLDGLSTLIAVMECSMGALKLSEPLLADGLAKQQLYATIIDLRNAANSARQLLKLSIGE